MQADAAPLPHLHAGQLQSLQSNVTQESQEGPERGRTSLFLALACSSLVAVAQVNNADHLLEKTPFPKLLRGVSMSVSVSPHPPCLLYICYLPAPRGCIFSPCVTLETGLFILSESKRSRWLEPDMSSSRLSHSLNLLFCWLLFDNCYALLLPQLLQSGGSTQCYPTQIRARAAPSLSEGVDLQRCVGFSLCSVIGQLVV